MMDWCAIQRKLHDAGAFVFAFQRLNELRFLNYIPTVLREVLQTIEQYPEFRVARQLLELIFEQKPALLAN